MIIKKNDDRNLLPTDVIGSSVARSKRWLVAIVRICHEKKTGERLTKMGIENFLPIQQKTEHSAYRSTRPMPRRNLIGIAHITTYSTRYPRIITEILCR
jgi:hypothetical protein